MEKFKCKSEKLKKFLMQNGLRYTWVDVDPIDNMTYWIFDKDDKFNGYFYVYNLLNKLQK